MKDLEKMSVDELIQLVVTAGDRAVAAWNILYKRDVAATKARNWSSSEHLNNAQLNQMYEATREKIPVIANHIWTLLANQEDLDH